MGRIFHLLKTTKHHGFPVVNEKGILRGFILRKTLTTLLKLKAFSQPIPSSLAAAGSGSLVQLAPAATVFFDTVERNYPEYPSVEDSKIIKSELVSCSLWMRLPSNQSFLNTINPSTPQLLWLDLRAYYDGSPFTCGVTASVQRSYKLFRTMGLRHLIVVDRDNRVVGIVTRQDITEHRLHEKWHHEGSEMQKHLTIEVLQPSFVNVNADLEDENGVPYEYFGDDESVFADSSIAGSEVGDGEPRPPRGTCVCVY